MKALILSNILKSGDPEHSYEIHVPNIPDICGDIVTIIIFVFAYFFIRSASLKKLGINTYYPESFKNLTNWSKGIFSVTILGFGLYFLSKYFLSIDLEVFAEGADESPISTTLIYLNYAVKICSALILVYAYCKYVSPNKAVKMMLYTFFFVRNLLATNLLGLITQYDLYPCAPFLDILSPIIIVYSIIGIII